MPKFLIAQSMKDKKVRKLESSMPNMKALLKKRAEKDEEDCEFLILTFNEKITIAFLRDLWNKSMKKLKKHDACIAVDRLHINTETWRSKLETE